MYVTREGGTEREKGFGQHDQFGDKLVYFSQCILQNREPEPGGLEGLADVRVVEAMLKSMRPGQAAKLEPFDVPARPNESQKFALPKVKAAKVVEAESPSGKK